ncbi:MAG: hypothetical protein ACFCU4_03555 [Puniceicoccaceae bacterium]
MKPKNIFNHPIVLVAALTIFASAVESWGMSLIKRSLAERAEVAEAVVTGEIVLVRGALVDGRVHTRFTIRSLETIKGIVPEYFEVIAPGGVYGLEGVADSRLPEIEEGAAYLFLIDVEDERLVFHESVAGVNEIRETDLILLREVCADLVGADLSQFARDPISVRRAVTESGLIELDGVRRFTLPDQGIPIPVVADTSTLPAGLSEAQALQALQNSLEAWASISSLRFEFVGTEVFPKSAIDYTSNEGSVIRVQMHDDFLDIGLNSSTLGFGGASFFIDPGLGATVDGLAFNRSNFGFVVLNHRAASMSDPATFEEVLAHELGHVIGLDHSSEDTNETDPLLAEAMMFFEAKADGRGASLNAYDIDTVLKAHPMNTPPYGFNRVLYAITTPGNSLANPNANSVVLSAGDLDGDALTFIVQSQTTSNGTFSVVDGRVFFQPSGFFSDTSVGDPATSFFARLIAKAWDGVHLSPPIEVRIAGFRSDTRPVGAPDGIPDSWMLANFGSIDGASATGNFDGDPYTNYEEYRMGTDPRDPNSRFKITEISPGKLQWTAQRFDSYLIESTTDFVVWRFEALRTETDGDGLLEWSEFPGVDGDPIRFYRILRID